MTLPTGNGSTREQLRLALRAAGIAVDDHRLDELLPGYEGVLTGAARLREIELHETEPSVIYRLPQPE